jgi:hypothetical protein
MSIEQLFDVEPSPDRNAPLELREVRKRITAENWCARYDWTGTAGSLGLRYWGAWRGDLACIVGIGLAPNEHGLREKYDLTPWPGNLMVARLAPHPDADPHDATDLLLFAESQLFFLNGTTWVYGYVPIGSLREKALVGIYESVEAVEVESVPPRAGWLLDGEQVHNRTIVQRYGTESELAVIAQARLEGRRLERVPDLIPAKRVFVAPFGSAEARRQIRRRLQDSLART